MWISPQEMYINNTDGNYEISDFGRVLTILQAESENEGKYTCEQSGKNESVFLNVTCKICVKFLWKIDNYLIHFMYNKKEKEKKS